MATNNFASRSKDDFEVICNVVLGLPREYDCHRGDRTLDCDEEETAKHKHLCYFVMNNGCT